MTKSLISSASSDSRNISAPREGGQERVQAVAGVAGVGPGPEPARGVTGRPGCCWEAPLVLVCGARRTAGTLRVEALWGRGATRGVRLRVQGL